MKLRTVAMTGVMSLAGLGLIGVGAHAQFTTSTQSSQSVSTGTPGVTLSGSCINGTTCAGNPTDLYSLSPDGTSLTFTPGGPYGSSFTTGDEQVTMTNTGNIPLTELVFTISSTYPTSALATEAYVCVSSTGIGTGGTPYPFYNGPLSGVPAGGWGQQGDTLTVAGTPATLTSAPTDNYVVDVYAGDVTTACGVSTAPALLPAAESESIAITATMTYQG